MGMEQALSVSKKRFTTVFLCDTLNVQARFHAFQLNQWPAAICYKLNTMRILIEPYSVQYLAAINEYRQATGVSVGGMGRSS